MNHNKIFENNKQKFCLGPRIRSITYPNLLRAYVLPRREPHTVSVQAWVETGSMNEGRDLGCGLSHFLEHMAFAGTKKFPGGMVSDTITALGGRLNAYTSYDATVYYMDVPSEHWKTALDLLDDMLREPLFPEERFQLEKEVILREAAMYRDNADAVLMENLWRTSFLRHPVRHPVIGYTDKIRTVNRDMMQAYHDRRYTPGRTFYVISGAVDADEVFRHLETTGAAWASGSLEEPELPAEPRQSDPRRQSAEFNDPLYRLGCAWHIPNISHPDIPAIDVLSMILGSGGSSRLNRALKIDHSLAIQSDAFCFGNSTEGTTGLYVIANPAKREAILETIQDVLKELREHGVTREEMSRAVALQTVDHLRTMRTDEGMARTIGGSVLSCGTPDAADHYLELIGSLTQEDLLRAAKTYFSENAVAVAELLPAGTAKKIASQPEQQEVRDLPKLKKFRGGQKLIYYQDRSLPLTDAAILLPGGLSWEKPDEYGKSRLAAMCLGDGCARYPEREFNEFLENHAIDLNVDSGMHMTVITLNCTSDKLEEAAEAVSAMLSAPLFRRESVERERADLIDCIHAGESDPMKAAANRMYHVLYGDHPYANCKALPEELISKYSAEELKEHYFRNMLPARNCCIAISGNLSEKEAEKFAQTIIKAVPWSKGSGLKQTGPAHLPEHGSEQHVTVAKEQTVILTALPGVDMKSPDRTALDLLRLATNQMSSRLFKTVREDEGLAYYTGLQVFAGLHGGHLTYYAGTRPEAAQQVKQLIDAEIDRIGTKGLTKAEFEAAQRTACFALEEEEQSPNTKAVRAAVDEFCGLGYDAGFHLREDMAQLTRKEANAVYAALFRRTARFTVTAGPDTKGTGKPESGK